MNAGTAHITNMSPYYVRTSFSMWHAGHAMGEAAAKQLERQDRGGRLHRLPARQGHAGRVQDGVRGVRRQGDRRDPDGRRRLPCPTSRRSSSAPRTSKPDVFFVFVPAGDHSTAVVRTYDALGMKEAGIKLIGPGDITQDNKLQADGPVRGRPDHHASLQCRPRQSPRTRDSSSAWKKDYGAELDAGLHGGRRL